jgi:hypothetical protein
VRKLLILAVAGVVLAGCGGSSGTGRSSGGSAGPSPSPATASSAAAPASATGPAGSAADSSAAGHAPRSSATPLAVPHFSHVVVVVEENHASSQVIGDPQAPYMNALGRSGVVLTSSYGITHPSEPNYLALFSGSTQGLRDDSCPHTYGGDNLGHQLLARGRTFVGYSESLPSTGYRGCNSGPYARRHVPWVDFSNLPASVNKPMSAFPSDYTKLPALSFVIPNVDDDMHNGTVQQADTWLRQHLGGYVTWARTHDSLLVLTWDEDDNTARNQIPGVLVGAHVKAGRYSHRVDHYTMLRTLEAAFALPALGAAAGRQPISGIWVS